MLDEQALARGGKRLAPKPRASLAAQWPYRHTALLSNCFAGHTPVCTRTGCTPPHDRLNTARDRACRRYQQIRSGSFLHRRGLWPPFTPQHSVPLTLGFILTSDSYFRKNIPVRFNVIYHLFIIFPSPKLVGRDFESVQSIYVSSHHTPKPSALTDISFPAFKAGRH
jgi:hypothetical protein